MPVDDFADVVQRQLGSSAHLAATPDGRLDVYLHQDASGSRATMTLEDRRVICVTPTFRAGTQLTEVGARQVTPPAEPPPSTQARRPRLEVIYQHGEMAYPLAVAIEDLATSVLGLPSGQWAALEVVAIADEFSLFPDDAAYRASGNADGGRVAHPLPASSRRASPSPRGSRCAR